MLEAFQRILSSFLHVENSNHLPAMQYAFFSWNVLRNVWLGLSPDTEWHWVKDTKECVSNAVEHEQDESLYHVEGLVNPLDAVQNEPIVSR